MKTLSLLLLLTIAEATSRGNPRRQGGYPWQEQGLAADTEQISAVPHLQFLLAGGSRVDHLHQRGGDASPAIFTQGNICGHHPRQRMAGTNHLGSVAGSVDDLVECRSS